MHPPAVGGQLLLHLQDGDLVPLPGQRHRLFRADEAAAHYHYVLPHPGVFPEVCAENHAGLFVTGDGEHPGLCADGDDEGIGPHLVHQLAGDGGVQPDVDGKGRRFCGKILPIAGNVMLKVRAVGILEAAQLVGGLTQHHPVAPSVGLHGRLTACRATAGNEDSAAVVSRNGVIIASFVPDEGVHRAVEHPVFHQSALALATAQAGADVLYCAMHHLAGEEGVCDEGTAHGDAVHPGLLQECRHPVRFGEGAHGADGGFDVLFDLGGKAPVLAVLLESTGMHEDGGVLLLLASGRHMDEVHLAVQGLGDLDAGVQLIAALHPLRAGNAHVNGEALPHRGTDLLDDQQRKAHAVFQAPAPLVGAVIGDGGNELVEKPTVAHVDHDHVKAAGLGGGGSRTKLVGDVIDLLLGHLLHFVPPLVHIAGGADGIFSADEVGGAEGAAVVDLNGGGSTPGVNGLRHLHQIGNGAGVIQPHLLGMRTAGVQIHDHVAHRHHRAASGCLQAVIIKVCLGVMLPGAKLCQGRGSGQHSVFQRQPRHLQRP